MLCDKGVDQFSAVGFEGGQPLGFVIAHETRIAGHIGGNYCSKAALDAFFSHRCVTLSEQTRLY